MRVKIKFTPNTQAVPIQNFSLMNSYIHKCIGHNNPYHDNKGSYNISSLQGGKKIYNADFLNFEEGGFICISALSDDLKLIDVIMKGITDNPEFGFGMRFDGIEFMQDKFINGVNNFLTLSPILLKEKQIDQKDKHWTINDSDFEDVLTQRTIKKLLRIRPDLNLKGFKITIPKRDSNKVKHIMVKNVVNHASQCPVDITCSKEVAEIIYNIGLGQSTNSGFGCIYKAESHRHYRNQKHAKVELLQPV